MGGDRASWRHDWRPTSRVYLGVDPFCCELWRVGSGVSAGVGSMLSSSCAIISKMVRLTALPCWNRCTPTPTWLFQCSTRWSAYGLLALWMFLQHPYKCVTKVRKRGMVTRCMLQMLNQCTLLSHGLDYQQQPSYAARQGRQDCGTVHT